MNQPIICFEGPSGIGKTTMCKLFTPNYNIIPEVNLLFKRTGEEPRYWYYEKQVQRYELCKKVNKNAILDGDIFQPIWYNWAYNYPPEFLSKDEIHTFYKAKISEGKIAFPDLYILFEAGENDLWARKEKDKTRQRKSFEKHLKFIKPQKEYYRFLDQETELAVRFIDYSDFDKTRKKVSAAMVNLSAKKKKVDGIKIFKQIEDWISKRKNRVIV